VRLDPRRTNCRAGDAGIMNEQEQRAWGRVPTPEQWWLTWGH
jgi:hypothetical protein